MNKMCKILAVSRSGYRHHFSKEKTATEVRKIELLAAIKNINNDRKLRCYGSPRMTAELRARGFDVSENTVAKYMREYGIFAHKAKPWKPKTTMQDKTSMPSPNLLKNQHSSRFGEVLVADITYIPVHEGWIYLSTIMDLHSRAILGYQSDDKMPSDLVVRSLQKAVGDWNLTGKNCIFHSDRGCQYTSQKLRNCLKNNGFKQSMSAKGYCYDNATQESFFAGLKRELLPDSGYFNTKKQAQLALFEHIDAFYNTRRRHSSLGNISPFEFLKLPKNHKLLTKNNKNLAPTA